MLVATSVRYLGRNYVRLRFNEKSLHSDFHSPVCSLDLAHQLLETKQESTEQKNETSQETSWGIPLAKSVKATNISLLAEPGKDQSKSRENDPRRAVVFVSSANMETRSVDYAVFQLQLTRRNKADGAPAESYAEQKPYSVLVNPSGQGTIKNGTRSVGPVSSLFLAGASFKFDLSVSWGKKSTLGFDIPPQHTNFLLPVDYRTRRRFCCLGWYGPCAWWN
jgi:hypothetical protein